MSFCPSDNVAEGVRALLKKMAVAGDSQAFAVADCLNDIADGLDDGSWDLDEDDRTQYLIECAEEIRDWAVTFIRGAAATLNNDIDHLDPAPRPVVVIAVKSGCVTDVAGLPPGYSYIVDDQDIQEGG